MGRRIFGTFLKVGKRALVVLLPLLVLLNPVQTQAQSGGGRRLFVPLAMGGSGIGPPQPTSIQLIDLDVLLGQITEAQARLYRLQATVGDPALPAKYRGADAGRDGTAIMAGTVAKLPTLPPQEATQLRPYLKPPAAPGSWGQILAESDAGPAQAVWDTVATANGKVKVWYRTNTPWHGARAVAIANAINSTIWPKLTTWMREPLADCGATCAEGGGDTRVDIYLANVSRNYVVPFNCCGGSAAYAVIRPDTSFAYVARTMMRLIQFAYPIASFDEYRWVMDATAQFAMHYVYPSSNNDPDFPAVNEEHAMADEFLYRPLYPLETVEDGREYGAYLLFMFIDDPSTVPDVWNQATMPDSLANINSQLFNGFQEQWPVFAVENWNRPPVDYYKQRDNLTIGAEMVDDIPMTSPGIEEFIVNLDHLSAAYNRFTFPNRQLKRISVFNPIAGAGDPAGALWAIMKIDGTWRAPQDWTDRSHEIFCRDLPDQNLEELILVISNREWQDRSHVLDTDNGSIRVSPDCGDQLVGTFTWRNTGQYSLPSGSNGNTDRTGVVNVKLRFDEETLDYVDDGSTFNFNSTWYDEVHWNTGELAYVAEWTEQGSGAFDDGDGPMFIKGSVAYHETSADTTWIGAKVKFRQTGTKTFHPSGMVVPIDAEATLTLMCDHPTGVQGKRNENGVFDMTCSVTINSNNSTERTTVSGSLSLQ